MDEPLDDSVIAGAAGGDAASLERLYEEYRPMVYAVGLGVCGNGTDADEVLQETFLRAFRSLSEWRGASKFGTWLYAIALRTALNWKSRFLRKRPLPAPPAEGAPAFEALERAEALESLESEIARLPVQQRLVLTLKHLRGLSLAEIADLQQCAVGTVKSNLHHAMVKLKDALAGGVERSLL